MRANKESSSSVEQELLKKLIEQGLGSAFSKVMGNQQTGQQNINLDASNDQPMPSSGLPPQSYSTEAGIDQAKADELNQVAPNRSPSGEEQRAPADIGQAVKQMQQGLGGPQGGMLPTAKGVESETKVNTSVNMMTPDQMKQVEAMFYGGEGPVDPNTGVATVYEGDRAIRDEMRSIQDAEKIYKKMQEEGTAPDLNFQGALMLADSLLGTKLSASYTPPKTRESKLKDLLEQRDKITSKYSDIHRRLTDYMKAQTRGIDSQTLRTLIEGGYVKPPKTGLEDNRRNRQIEIDVKKLSSDMSPYVKYVEALRGIKGTLNNMSKSGVPMAIPQRLALNDPTKDISDLRRQTLKIVNSLLKEQSGTAVSAQEAARKFKEEGLHPLSTNEAFFSGLEELSSELQKSAQNVFNGYSSEVIGRWKGVKPSDITILGRPADDREKLRRQREDQRKKIEAELKKLGG